MHVYIHRCLANRTITGYISFYLRITSSPIHLTVQSHTRCTNTEPFTIKHLDGARFNTLLQTLLSVIFHWNPLPADSGGRAARGLRRGSAVSRLLAWWIRIQQGAWIFVSCESCTLSLRHADPSSRGVLRACVCVCRWMRLGGNNPLHLQWAGRKRPE